MPLLPIFLLTVDSMAGPYSVSRFLVGPGRILAAMMIGVAAAGLTSLGKSRGLAAAFFDGAGYAYTHIISLIMVASTYAARRRAERFDRALDRGDELMAERGDGGRARGFVVPGVRCRNGHCRRWRSWSFSCRRRDRWVWTRFAWVL